MTLCPACGAQLQDGALRCGACGQDARAARSIVGTAVPLSSTLTPTQRRALALLERLEALAPEVAGWLRDPHGPCPAVGPEVEGLLAELRSHGEWE